MEEHRNMDAVMPISYIEMIDKRVYNISINKIIIAKHHHHHHHQSF
jgi:hypothetical protein